MTLDPYVVGRRLAVLGFEPSKEKAFIVAHAMGPGDPSDLLDQLIEHIVFIARYMRQDLATIEAMSLDESRRYANALMKFIRAEGGGDPESDKFEMREPGAPSNIARYEDVG